MKMKLHCFFQVSGRTLIHIFHLILVEGHFFDFIISVLADWPLRRVEINALMSISNAHMSIFNAQWTISYGPGVYAQRRNGFIHK